MDITYNLDTAGSLEQRISNYIIDDVRLGYMSDLAFLSLLHTFYRI